MAEPIRVTQPLNYFKAPWYIEWVLKAFAKQFKLCADVEKAQKYAMRDLKRIMTDATDIGTEVDAIIKKDPYAADYKSKDVDVQNCLTAYMKWRAIYQPVSVVSCERFYTEVDGIAVSGEPDLIIDGAVLVDVKCSKRISKTYWLQVNAYRALRGETGLVGILRLDKETGSYQYEVQDFDDKIFSVWCGLMRAMVFLNDEGEGDDDDDS